MAAAAMLATAPMAAHAGSQIRKCMPEPLSYATIDD